MAVWLSHHVRYACQHAGACCSSGWPIPLERDREPTVVRAMDEGRLTAPGPWLLPLLDPRADVAGHIAASGGRCVFHQPVNASGGERRCAIHVASGTRAMPSACQHFPRVCLIDDRGVFVTLSHYCPTAAALLASHEGPIRIVDGPDPLPGRVPEGLDARGEWPPLLAPRVLMDLPNYGRWESHLVEWLGGPRNPDGEWAPEEVLTLLAAQAQTLATWRPGRRSLHDVLDELARPAPTRLPIESGWRACAVPVNRFLAAHAFASWTAYQGNGVVSQVKRLWAVLDTLRGEVDRTCRRDGCAPTAPSLLEAIRHTDWLVRHVVDSCRTRN